MNIDIQSAALFVSQVSNKIVVALIANNFNEKTISRVANNLPQKLLPFLLEDTANFEIRKNQIEIECDTVAARVAQSGFLWNKNPQPKDIQNNINETLVRTTFESIAKRVQHNEKRMAALMDQCAPSNLKMR